jgi:PEP-CTERM motif-containing protein
LIALDPTTLILSGYSTTKLLFNFFGESLIGFDMGTPFGPTSFDRNFPAITNLPLRLKGEPTFFFIEGVISDVTLQSYYSTPEASTWAMMALGFGGIGFVAFRKRGKPAAV